MKKLKVILVSIIICITFGITSTFASTGTVNVDGVRLREKANTTSNIITVIYENEKVEILAEEGDWYKVKYGKQEGYLKKEFLKVSNNISNSNSSNGNNNSIQNSSNQNMSSNLNSSVSNNINSNNVQNTSVNNNQNQVSENPNSQDTTKVIITSMANLRLIPNIMSKIIMQLEVGKELTKVSEINNWIQITDGTNSGWILKTKTNISTNVTDTSNIPDNTSNISSNSNLPTSSDNSNSQNEVEQSPVETNKVSNINKQGIINVETAKVRAGASLKDKIIDFLDYNDKVSILEETGDWYKISIENITGYVNKTLVKVVDSQTVSSRSLTEDRANNDNASDLTTNIENQNNEVKDTYVEEIPVQQTSNNTQSVVDYAKQFLGASYVIGGKNPNTGFDCSGFTRYVFLNFGYSLGSTAASQNSIGTEISRENLQPGDLILFYDDGKTKTGHTGIYLGNNEFIHAANPSRGVVIDNINTNSYYNERFITARRIVE